MAIGDVGVLRVVGKFMDQNVVNTIHYEVTHQSGSDTDMWQTLAAEWELVNEPAWATRHSSSYELTGIKVFTAKGDSSPPGYHPVSTVGGVPGDPQESFICRVITWYTDSPNPRVRGRLMLSGGVESQFDDSDGSVTDTEVGLLTAIGDTLALPLTPTGYTFTPVIFNRTLDTTHTIIKSLGRSTPAVLRSRRFRQYLIG